METHIEHWLDSAIRGNDEAYGHLVEYYQTGVFNLCYRMLGNRQEAEDAAQEVFWRAYNALHRYDRDRSFQTWLLSIASHYCIDQQRKRKLTLIDIDEPFEETFRDGNSPTPEKTMLHREISSQFEAMLDTLKPTDRATLVLRYWYEMSEKEIAESLSLSVSAVKSRLFRARKELALAFDGESMESEMNERELYEPSNV